MTGGGWALRLRFSARLEGSCMRCLEPAAPAVEVDAREVEQAGAGEELDSPYVDGDALDLRAWTRDALALARPAKLLCRPDCAGLCPVCGENLNEVPGHAHERGARSALGEAAGAEARLTLSRVVFLCRAGSGS